jgi:uncharacterized protein (TIGR02246 family)
MKKLVSVFVIAMAVVAGAAEIKSSKSPMEAAQTLFDKAADGFNRSDARAFSALWADDGQLINPAGVSGKGRSEIEKIAADDMSTILKGGKSKFTVQSVRQISPDAIWVDAAHDITGLKSPDGKDSMHLHVIGLMVQKSGQWWIAEARPYAFLPPPNPPSGARR